MPPSDRRRRKPIATGPNTTHWTAEEKAAHLQKERLNTPVATMKLSVRTINTLEEYDVVFAHQLLDQTYETLMRMKNFGDKTLKEVRDAIVALGLQPPNWKKPPKAKRPAKPKGRTQNKPIIPLW